MPVLKVGVPDVRNERFASGEQLQVRSSLLIVRCRAGGGIYAEIFVLGFHFCFHVFLSLSAWCEGVTLPAFRFLPEKIVAYVAVHLVCPLEEVTSGSSYVTALNCKLRKVLKISVARSDISTPPCEKHILEVKGAEKRSTIGIFPEQDPANQVSKLKVNVN